MLFNKKPHLFFEFLEKSVRYMAVDKATHDIIEKDELFFESAIVKDGNVTDASLIENRLRALLIEKKWKNAKASIILPEDHISLKEEIVPVQLEGREIRDYLTLHLNHSIRVPYKKGIFQHDVLRKDETNQYVMMMVYSEDAVKQWEEILESISLKPVVAGVSFMALYRVLLSQGKVESEDKRHLLILQWNMGEIVINVFNRGVPRFSRRSRKDYHIKNWVLSETGEQTWNAEPEILEEIIQDKLNVLERFLEFYRYSVLNGEGSVTEVVLTGDYPYLDQVKDHLSNRFYLNISKMETAEDLESKYFPLYGLSIQSNKKVKKGES